VQWQSQKNAFSSPRTQLFHRIINTPPKTQLFLDYASSSDCNLTGCNICQLQIYKKRVALSVYPIVWDCFCLTVGRSVDSRRFSLNLAKSRQLFDPCWNIKISTQYQPPEIVQNSTFLASILSFLCAFTILKVILFGFDKKV